MLFFEYSFLFVFLPLVLAVYFSLPHAARNTWLLVSSCVFYSFSSWMFLPVLFCSIVVDFVAGGRIARTSDPAARKRWLILSLVTNLGALAGFKYLGLITSGLGDLFGHERIPLLEAALPIGISFYTFQSMSYSLDLYRRRIQPASSFRDFAAYVSMFPQLIAGPIVRYADLEPQLARREYSTDQFASGVYLFVVGMAKKLLIADTLAKISGTALCARDPGFCDAWIAMMLFSGQIYFDFSAYSDMAIGLGRLFGFEFPENFRSPYRATSFADFWRRWHITLSSWLRDYLYIPLGGSRRGALRTYLNLLVTMLLGGLWHGASWNFLLWGGVHGALLALERLCRGRLPAPPKIARQVLIFLAVTAVWVPFKFEAFSETLLWWGAMFGGAGLGSASLVEVGAAALMLLLVWLPRRIYDWDLRFDLPQIAYASALFISAILIGYGRVEISPFLYFRF